MANLWWLASTITVVSLCISPVISFHINKKLSNLYDASKKVPELLSDTIPILKYALRKVEEQWILKLSADKSSGVLTLKRLESLLKSLKNALYEAEDIVDLIDYHRLDGKARGELHDSSWLQWYMWGLYNSIRETFALRLQWLKQSSLGRCAGERSVALCQWVQQSLCWLGRRTHRSDTLPLVHGAHPNSFDFKNCCRTMINVLVKACEFVNCHRDSAIKNAGFEYKQDVDCTIMGPLSARLKENMKRIEELFDEAGKCTSFKQRVQEAIGQADQPRSSGSSNTPNVTALDKKLSADPAIKVIGREKVLKEIQTMLHDSNSSENAIAICDIPGSGKTTLAQYVYQSEKEGGYFDIIMWVHVSQNFSVDAIFRQMYETASPNGGGKNVCPPYNSLEALRTELVNKLKKKRLLLVLDDIWPNKVVDGQSLPELVSVVSPFKDGSIGSKILVTSRTTSALTALGSDVRCEIYPIPPLDGKDFFKLLMYYACVDTRDGYGSPIHDIGLQIAKDMKGLPLAGRLVGCILSKNVDVDSWRNVRDRKHLNQTTRGDLWWCYQHLDEHIRRCFAFCSIFPRGFHLFRVDLVNLWVAQGFTRSTDEGEEMEDVGEEYFRELVSTSFLQPGGMQDGMEYYLVHDALHELAEEVAGTDCFRIENAMSRSEGKWINSSWPEEIPRDVCHLFVLNYDGELITGKILDLEYLRTLIIYNVKSGVPVEDKVTESIFERLRKLRVMAIAFDHDSYAMIEGHVSVPESACQSKQLRYLALHTTSKRRVTFPRTPTKLYHLRLLDVGDAEDVEFSCNDLTNLRHVLGKEVRRISNFGKMKSLQTRSNFHVSKEQGCKITELRDINKLRGSLSISALENVTSKEEALQANLAAKERLRKLELGWDITYVNEVGGKADPKLEAEVLEALCPPKNLETLRIRSYRGLTYPSWMLEKQNGGPESLKILVFSNCRRWGAAPKLEAFIYLHSLELNACSWDALPGNMEHLTLLKELLILFCTEIRSLPTLPLSIEKFAVSYCNHEFMTSLEKNGSNWEKIKDIPNREILPSKGYPRARAFVTDYLDEDIYDDESRQFLLHHEDECPSPRSWDSPSGPINTCYTSGRICIGF